MGHVIISMKMKVLPHADSKTSSVDQGEMTAEVVYTPPHSATDVQIGNQVERIVKRLGKLADD